MPQATRQVGVAMDWQSPRQNRVAQLIASTAVAMAIAASLAIWSNPSQPARHRWHPSASLRGLAYTLISVFLAGCRQVTWRHLEIAYTSLISRYSHSLPIPPIAPKVPTNTHVILSCFLVRMCHPMLAMEWEIPDSIGGNPRFRRRRQLREWRGKCPD
jgi:hypothetical protein